MRVSLCWPPPGHNRRNPDQHAFTVNRYHIVRSSMDGLQKLLAEKMTRHLPSGNCHAPGLARGSEKMVPEKKERDAQRLYQGVIQDRSFRDYSAGGIPRLPIVVSRYSDRADALIASVPTPKVSAPSRRSKLRLGSNPPGRNQESSRIVLQLRDRFGGRLLFSARKSRCRLSRDRLIQLFEAALRAMASPSCETQFSSILIPTRHDGVESVK